MHTVLCLARSTYFSPRSGCVCRRPGRQHPFSRTVSQSLIVGCLGTPDPSVPDSSLWRKVLCVNITALEHSCTGSSHRDKLAPSLLRCDVPATEDFACDGSRSCVRCVWCQENQGVSSDDRASPCGMSSLRMIGTAIVSRPVKLGDSHYPRLQISNTAANELIHRETSSVSDLSHVSTRARRTTLARPGVQCLRPCPVDLLERRVNRSPIVLQTIFLMHRARPPVNEPLDWLQSCRRRKSGPSSGRRRRSSTALWQRRQVVRHVGPDLAAVVACMRGIVRHHDPDSCSRFR